jgi:hypothetical protein
MTLHVTTPVLEQRATAEGGNVPLSALPDRSRLVSAVMPANMSGMVPERMVFRPLIFKDVSDVYAARLGRVPEEYMSCIFRMHESSKT